MQYNHRIYLLIQPKKYPTKFCRPVQAMDKMHVQPYVDGS